MAIASPTLFICVVSVGSACGMVVVRPHLEGKALDLGGLATGVRLEAGERRAGDVVFEYVEQVADGGKTSSIPSLTRWTNRTNEAAMKTVNVHEAKTNFSSLLAKLEADSETIVICRNGEPVADLVPHKRANRIKPHPVLGKMKIKYDPAEPASEADWPRRYR